MEDECQLVVVVGDQGWLGLLLGDDDEAVDVLHCLVSLLVVVKS